MVDPVADSIASGALVISLIAIITGEVRASKSRSRDRNLGPAEDIRKSLFNVREVFRTMVNKGGNHKEFFLGESIRTTGPHLRDLAAQVGDQTLRSRITAVADSWDEAFENAPPSRIRVQRAGADNSANRIEGQKDRNRLDVQVEAANRGIEQCAVALERLNEIWLS